MVAYFFVNGQAQGRVQGSVLYSNSFGYLEAEYFWFIHYSFYLTVFYIALWIAWMMTLATYQENIILHHRVLTVLILFSLVIEMSNFILLARDNAIAESSAFIYLVFLMQVFRESLVRYLALMYSFGWGIAASEIPQKQMIAIFAIVYFSISLFESPRKALHSEPNPLSVVKVFIDALWGTGIIHSVYSLYLELKEKQQHIKAQFYLHLGQIGAFSLMMATVFVFLARMYVGSKWRYESPLQMWWYADGCWRFQFALILVLCAWLYRPTETSSRLVQSHQIATCEEDAEHFMMESDEDYVDA